VIFHGLFIYNVLVGVSEESTVVFIYFSAFIFHSCFCLHITVSGNKKGDELKIRKLLKYLLLRFFFFACYFVMQSVKKT